MIERIRALVAELRTVAGRVEESGREVSAHYRAQSTRRIADQLDAILADAGGWRSMDSAPKDCRILISRRGKVHIGWFSDDSSARKPRPFWHGGDADMWGLRWAKANPPDGWKPLPDAIEPPPQEPPR